MEAFTLNNGESFFGREGLISQLMYRAKCGDSVKIIGSRRFGKTCLLERCIIELESADNNIVPVLIDTKTDVIEGDKETYRYMFSKLLVALYKYKCLANTEIVGTININDETQWIDVDSQLSNADFSDRQLEGLLKHLIKSTDKKILFMIDEYEYLLLSSFSKPVAFMPLRFMASKPEFGFSFWVAGGSDWSSNSHGSGEINVCIPRSIDVNRISKDKFAEMWQYECSLIEDENKRKRIESQFNFAFEKSGGIPHYGKNIGKCFMDNDSICDYTILSSNFNEIIEKLPNDELMHLKELSNNLTFKYKGVVSDRLIQKGLVEKINRDECRIVIPFLKDYVYNLTLSEKASNYAPTMPSIQSTLVGKILKNIELINDTYNNKRHKWLFEPTTQYTTQSELSKIVTSDKDYMVFSNTLYTFYYEQIKNWTERSLTKYQISASSFVKIIDTNRHVYGKAHPKGTFHPKPGRMKKEKMLEELLGNRNEPYTATDFQKMQLEILKRFDKEVENLLNDVKKIR